MSQRSAPKPPKILFYSFPLFFQLFKICAEHEEWNERVKRYRVTMAEACLSHFGINPLWLTSTVEIKAVICLKRLNNVKHSVKHTPAALYIMHQRPAEGKDNMTYPQERKREGKRERGKKRRWTDRCLGRSRGWMETEEEMRGSAMRI